jgi:putative oxidoreductase
MSDAILLYAVSTMPALVVKLIAGLCAAFLGITFLQSAFDKISNYPANKAYFQSQFATSPLRNSVHLLLPVLTVLELLSGLGCIGGIVLSVLYTGSWLIGYGLFAAACTLLCLLSGQRIAKDYAGAASLTGYFLIAVFGLMAFSVSF